MARAPYAYPLTALVLAAGIAATACGKSSTSACSGTPPNLVGTYDLVSYTTGSTTITPPDATGTLRLHVGTYGIDLTLPGPIAVSDSGTYTQCGASNISESSVMGLPQFTGTATLSNGTLTVAGTAAGTTASSIWTKQP